VEAHAGVDEWPEVVAEMPNPCEGLTCSTAADAVASVVTLPEDEIP
jgi:hypothetical protein